MFHSSCLLSCPYILTYISHLIKILKYKCIANNLLLTVCDDGQYSCPVTDDFLAEVGNENITICRSNTTWCDGKTDCPGSSDEPSRCGELSIYIYEHVLLLDPFRVTRTMEIQVC